MERKLIRNPNQVRQPIDYYGCSLDKNFMLTGEAIIQAMDIDGVIEQHWTPFKRGMKYRTAFLFIEHKTLREDGTECGMPKGQHDSYMSLVNQSKFTDYGEDKDNPRAPRGSFAMVVECYHKPVPEGETIKSHDCIVKKVYTSTDQKWINPSYKIGLPELVIYFFYLIGLRFSPIPTPEERKILLDLRAGDDSYGPQDTITV